MWRCHASGCVAGGGSGALLAAVRLGSIPPKGDPRWATVLGELKGEVIGATQQPRLPKIPPPPRYPPAREVLALWTACARPAALPDDHPAIRYLEDTRRLNVHALSRLDLVRVLPEQFDWPEWISRSVPKFYPIVIPVYDNIGILRSLRFRAISNIEKMPKSLPPRGYELSGLVMADGIGRSILQERYVHEGIKWDGRSVIAEGEPDFLSFCIDERRVSQISADGSAHAVFGVVSGSWSEGIANRIPAGSVVAVWTHLDAKGDSYAETIRRSLAERCEVRRPIPPAHGAPS